MKKHLSLALFLLASLLTLAVTAQAVCDPSDGWCPPTTSPPYPAGSVPLNTGSVGQTKSGWLNLGSESTTGLLASDFQTGGLGLFFSGLGVRGGNFLLATSTPALGKVLMSTDDFGIAAWVATSTLGLGEGGDYWTQTQVGTSTTFLLFPTATTTNVGVGTTTPNNLLQVAGLINFDNTKGNTFLGNQAGAANTTGDYNTAVGSGALYSNTTGITNVAVGNNALTTNTGGGGNVAMGNSALSLNTIGGYNTAVGDGALRAANTGNYNTAVGRRAGYGDGATVNQRSIIDTYATFLGYQASRDASIPNTTPLTNITAIGKNARVGASNAIVLGGTGTDAVKVGIGTANPDVTLDVAGDIEAALTYTGGSGYVSFIEGGVNNGGAYRLMRFSSSKRYKENISDFKKGLEIIEKLRPVEFNWKSTGDRDFGFIAEDAEKVDPLLVVRMNGEVETFKYMQLTAILTNAVKELKAENEVLKARIEALEEAHGKARP